MADRTCRTCRYRVNAISYVCSRLDTWRTASPTVVHNPVTGLTSTHYPEGWGSLRPTCTEMRVPEGQCGVEGRLYEPRWRSGLWRWLTGFFMEGV